MGSSTHRDIQELVWKLGNAPEAASRIVDDIRFRQVYHGSPASFGHFDHAFTGTGEGAQAYGWGTYVTEVKGIARKYAAIGIKRGNHITYDGELLSPVLDNEYYLMRYGGYGNARSFLPPMWTV